MVQHILLEVETLTLRKLLAVAYFKKVAQAYAAELTAIIKNKDYEESYEHI